MNGIKEHIAFKITTLFLVAALLVPTAVKFTHTFSHHKHEVCKNGNSTHIHKVDLDCDFHKFQLNSHLFFHFRSTHVMRPTLHTKISILIYNFFYNHRQLSFSLRGPPVLV